MNKCPTCANPLSYVEQYSQWYCYTCKDYQQPVTQQQQQAPPQHQQQHPQQQQQQAPPQHQQQHPQQQQQQAPSQQQPMQPNYPPAMGGELEYRVEHAPSFSTLIINLKPGQSVITEKGSMMYMQNTIDIETHGRKGGIMKGMKTSMMGGESFFVNTYTATRGPGELGLVGPTMGDIRSIDVSRQAMILQSGAFLASYTEVDLDTRWKGLKGYLSEREFVMLHASGPGKVWVTSFGSMMERELKPGETFTVDTGHLVAFPDNMQFSVRRVGGWKSTLLSGEGLVTDLVGPGKVLMQTRTMGAFAASLSPFLSNK